MIRSFFKLVCLVTVCNLVTLDITAARYSLSDDRSTFGSSLFKEHASLFALLGILSCSIAYRLFTKESVEQRAEHLRREREQRVLFEKQRKERAKEEFKRREEQEEEAIRKEQEQQQRYTEQQQQVEFLIRGVPVYLVGGLDNLYLQCGIDFETTPFAVLEVANNATETELRRAYRRAALRYHPDKNSDPRANVQFQLIEACYQRCLEIRQNPGHYGL